MPRPTKTSINIKPSVTPSKCGVVLLKPKLAPELINIKLFGPGVIDDTNANNAKAVKISKGGEIFILKMPSVRIKDLAENMIEVCHNSKNQSKIKIKVSKSR